MTYVVTNRDQFARAWERVQPGDSITVVVSDKADYGFKFVWRGNDSGDDTKGGKLPLGKAEWSGCCC
jgi:hypothetical protein